MDQPPNSPIAPARADLALHRFLERALGVRPAEVPALGWSWLYIFCVMSSYSILKPIRDDMGVASGYENLPWLFTATLVGMLLVNPAFAALVARLPRARFIAVSYNFFALNLLVFVLLLKFANPAQNLWVGRVFFVWTSIFNLFVVSVFWGLMVDVFDVQQGKRLFSIIAAGATLGVIVGASATAALAQRVLHMYLLLASAALLELAVVCVWRLSRRTETLRVRRTTRGQDVPIGGGAWSGLTRAFNSPYLTNIALFVFLYTVTATLLYFLQVKIAGTHFPDRGARVAFFARVDVYTNVLTLVTQLFLSGRIIRTLGVMATLAFLPVLCAVGFGALSLAPTIGVIVGFQVLRRAGEYALARPSRELLYTVAPREDKYKAKSFIDTVVYRTGDQVGAWTSALLTSSRVGLGIAGVALVAIPLSLAWAVNALWLGRKQERLASTAADHQHGRPVDAAGLQVG
jgi:AAA family ATP:ADP antiporter